MHISARKPHITLTRFEINASRTLEVKRLNF